MMRACLVSLLLPLALVGCSSSDAQPTLPESGPIKELSYEVFPFVLQLDDPARAALTESRDDGTLVFDESPAVLADVKQGSILLSAASDHAPWGLLRIVRAVEHQGGSLVLHTIGAPPQLAFRKLHVHATASIPTLTDAANEWQYPSLGPLVHGSAAGKEDINFYLFDGDGDTSTKDDQVHVSGELGGGLDYDVDVDTDWGALDAIAAIDDCVGKLLTFGLAGGDECELPEIKAYLYVTPNAQATITFEGAAFKGYEKEYTLASVVPAPGIIQVGPLTFVVIVDVIARVEGNASSRFQVGASASVKATTGVEFGSLSGVSFKPPVPEFEFAPEGTDVTLSGYAKVSVGPRLSFRLCGIAGPYAGLTASASVDADQSRTPCYDLHAGLDGEVGFILTLPGLGNLINEGAPFSILDESIASGSCNQPAGSSAYPPGAGPDADHLLNPTFTPWARMFDSPVVAVPHQGLDLAWLDLARSIDGHWVLAGSAIDALTKVDSGGNVVWSHRYIDMRPEPPEPYLVKRTLPTLGAGLLVVGHPYAVFEVGQSGGVKWATRFEAPGQVTETGPNGWQSDQRMFSSAADDGAGGYFVAGSYQADDDTPAAMWLVHLDREGSVLWSRQYGSSRFLYPTNLVALDGGVFVAGLDWDKGSHARGMFLARIDSDGDVAWASRHGGCDGFGYPGMQPFDALRLVNGDILVAAVLDLGRRSVLMEVTPQGEMRWATAQWSDDTLSDMAISSVRELPTTGFVVAGGYHYHFEQERVFLAGLDAKGRTQWLKVYGQPSTEAGIPAEQKFPAIALTDEGAVLMAAYTTAPVPSENDNVWMLQAAAKDGAIAFSSGQAEVLEYSYATEDCATSPEAVSFTAAPLDLAPESFMPVVEPVSVSVTTQTP